MNLRKHAVKVTASLALVGAGIFAGLAIGTAPAASGLAPQEKGPLERQRFVRSAWWRLLSRTPSGEELDACLESLDELHRVAPADSDVGRERRARGALVHALLNHNDFLMVR